MSAEIAPVEKVNQVTKKDIDSWLFGSNTKLTEAQKQLFYQVSLSFNLNPAKREVYAIPFGNNFNIITGFEVYLKRAERTGLLEWWETGVKKDNNEYVGFCTIKRKDRERPTTIEAWFNEYNQNNNMWKTKPRTMIRKVAIAQAFRMVFPDELGGLPYTADEMGTEIIETKPIDDDFPEINLIPTRVKEMIDSLNAAGKLGNAEKFLGRKSSEWTDEDIDKIESAKKRGRPKSTPESSESPQTAQTQETNGNGRGIKPFEGILGAQMVELINPNKITDNQIDIIDGMLSSKGLVLSNFIGSQTLTDLSEDDAASLIEDMASE